MSNPIKFPVAPDNGVWLGDGGSGPPVGAGFTIPPAKLILADYTLMEEDLMGILYCVSSIPLTITVPAGLRPNGFVQIVQSGVGRVNIVPAPTVTIDVPSGRVAGTNGTNTFAQLLKLTDTRYVSTSVSAPPSALPRVYWGSSSVPLLTVENVQAQGTILNAAGLPITVTYNNTGGRYPFFAHPSSWGNTSHAMIGAFMFTDLDITELQLPDGTGATIPFRVLRFRGIQHSSNQTVTW